MVLAELAKSEHSAWDEATEDAAIFARERDEARAEAKAAFVAGAAWWEFASTGSTIWQSDRHRAEAEAERRWPGVPWPPQKWAAKEKPE